MKQVYDNALEISNEIRGKDRKTKKYYEKEKWRKNIEEKNISRKLNALN